jgi:uncharacterized membrane protein
MEVLDEIVRKIDYKDNSLRARNVIFAFYGICVINILAVVSDYFQISLLEEYNVGNFISDEEADANDLRQMIIGVMQSVLFITTSVLFLVWFYRAYRNLHIILNERKMKSSISMTIWGFIIPIVSLFKPVQITNEITDKHTKILTKLNPNYVRISSKTLIGIWWTFYIVTNVIENITFRTVLRSDTIDEIIFSTKAYIVSDFIEIPAAIITVLMIRQISKEESMLSANISEIEDLISPPKISSEEE